MRSYRYQLFSIMVLACLTLAVATLVTAAAPPVAVADTYYTAPDDNLSVDAPGVLSNDSDPDGDPLTAILVDSSQATGLLLLADDGSFEYEPAPAFIGTDVFTYVANDGSADSNQATVTFIVTGTLDIAIYTDQSTFLNDLAVAGYTAFREGFEDDAVWGTVRTTIVGGQYTAPEIFSQGIHWRANNDFGEITTGEGPARRGNWGFFALPHGSFATGTGCNLPLNCGDGWQGTGDGRMVAIGGWVETNTPYAGIHMYLDGNLSAPIDFNGLVLGSQFQFIGIISPVGFDQFEIRETEGVAEDQKFIFADDFYYAFETPLHLKSSRVQLASLSAGTNVGGRVTVVDQDRNAVQGATVTAEWQLPDGSILPVSGVTNSLGRAQWRISSTGPGAYVLSVLDIDKPGYVFVGGAISNSLDVTAGMDSAETDW